MKLVVQRVIRAEVRVSGARISAIGPGLVVFVAIEKGDGMEDVGKAAEKIRLLRCFSDTAGKMNLSVGDVRGEILAVSQFTLAASLERGRRPSFEGAEAPERARNLYTEFCRILGEEGVPVREGEFGAHMEVELINDGPVTFIFGTTKTVKNSGT